MKTSHGAAILLIGVIATATAGADIIPTPDPGGYQTNLTLSGGEGVPAQPSRWFNILGGEAQYTAWSNKPISFPASLPEQQTDWRVGVTAINWNNSDVVLPPSYDAFRVAVSLDDHFVDSLPIPASDDKWQTAWLDLGSLDGDIDLKLNWKNDSWTPGVYDANIAIGAVQFARSPVPEPTTLLLVVAGSAVFLRPR